MEVEQSPAARPQLDPPLIFVYYNFRGQMQAIRHLLCYLELPFLEIHAETFEQKKSEISPEVLSQLAKIKINKAQLPALIHGTFYTEGQYCIITYLCKKFNREDLLGSNIRTKTRVQEMLEIYFTKQPQMMLKLLEIADKAFLYDEQTFSQLVQKVFQYSMNTCKYSRSMAQYLDAQTNPKYVLGQLTVLDFVYMETCVYSTGIFSDPKRVKDTPQESVDKHFDEKSNAYYLLVMRNFQQRMREEKWYVKNKEMLESFPIISPQLSPQRAAGLKKIWLGNPRFVS